MLVRVRWVSGEHLQGPSARPEGRFSKPCQCFLGRRAVCDRLNVLKARFSAEGDAEEAQQSKEPDH